MGGSPNRRMSVLVGVASLLAQDCGRDPKPPLFSYDELLQLGLAQKLSPDLAEKLHVITTTPFVNNEAPTHWMMRASVCLRADVVNKVMASF
jgi:hypothetical protein